MNFEPKFTRTCSCNPWLLLIYANGYNRQVKRINRGLIDLFLLFQLQLTSIGEGLGLVKNSQTRTVCGYNRALEITVTHTDRLRAMQITKEKMLGKTNSVAQ